MKLVKFYIACKETDCWINLKSHITCMKLLKYRSKQNEENTDRELKREDTSES